MAIEYTIDVLPTTHPEFGSIITWSTREYGAVAYNGVVTPPKEAKDINVSYNVSYKESIQSGSGKLLNVGGLTDEKWLEAYLSSLLPIIIYILLIALIILLIIISAKAIKALNKVQDVVDNVDKKVKTLDGVFDVIDLATDKISLLSDRIINVIAGAIEKVFKVKEKKTKKIEEDNDNE